VVIRIRKEQAVSISFTGTDNDDQYDKITADKKALNGAGRAWPHSIV